MLRYGKTNGIGTTGERGTTQKGNYTKKGTILSKKDGSKKNTISWWYLLESVS
jgi:hypothetical protein